jgi:branched-chain amino acid transport system ATP-binding protein
VSKPVFTVEHLHASYGALKVVDDLSISFETGSRTGIFGHNGSGKSTLLKCLVGGVKAVSGQILFNEEIIEPNLVHQNVRLGIGYVPQSQNIFPSLSVEKCLIIAGLSKENDDLQTVFNILPLLEERRKQRAGGLSGGEQQMLAVGMALMTKPTALLLDEPSAGLSPVAAKSIMNQLKTINAKHSTTIILVEQNVYTALAMVERAVVLKSGKIIYDGSASELEAKEDLWAWF